MASTAQATDLFLASRSTHVNIYQHHINSPLLPGNSHKSQSNFLPLPHFLYAHHALSPPLVFCGPPALPFALLRRPIPHLHPRNPTTTLRLHPDAQNPPAAFTPGLDDDNEPHLTGDAPPRAPKPQRYRHPRRRQSAPRPGRPPQSHKS